MAKPVLSLKTLAAERSKIEIDDQLYELRDIDEFSLAKIVDIERSRKRAAEIIAKPIAEMKPEEAAFMREYMSEMLILIVVDLPQQVVDKLRETQKVEIVRAFNSVAGERAPKATQPEEQSPTTEALSPGSGDSTAAP